MIIFIGGMAAHHQRRFAAEFPEVGFVFTAFDDPDNVWVRMARKADHVIVDQSRCSHDRIQQMKKAGIKPIFSDSKAEIRRIIQEIITNGQVDHRYTHPSGSSFFAFTSADGEGHGLDLPLGVAEVATSDGTSEPANQT